MADFNSNFNDIQKQIAVADLTEEQIQELMNALQTRRNAKPKLTTEEKVFFQCCREHDTDTLPLKTIKKKWKSKKIALICFTALITTIMSAVVAYNYRGMLCGIEHGGYSAPASVAFLYAIPFLLVIIVCAILAVVFHFKSK